MPQIPMKTAVYNKEKCSEVENAVIGEFGCSYSEIVNFTDTFSKKTVVFLLAKFYDFDKYNLGKAYQMTYLYVPTVVEQLEFQFLTDWSFREKIINVLKKLDYASKVDFRRIGAA